MANKKILYTGTDGKIRELASGSGANIVNYDDTPNAELVKTKNVSFTTMSFNNGNVGLPIVKNNAVTMLTASELDYVGWDNIAKTWKFMRGEYVDITNTTASANSDLSGTYGADIKVKSLSNVRTGTLGVQYGGTGLGSGSENNSFTNPNESILLGNGSDAFAFLTASQATSAVALASDGTGWTYVTQSFNNSTEVQVFSAPGTNNWTKPAGTKAIRVLVQGAGGGGGSGANRNSGVAALGGTGGSAGGFVDSGIISVDDGFLSASVTVGTGGLGANYVTTNSAGVAGSNGESSSFGSNLSGPYFVANGGLAGSGGNINSTVTSSGGASVSASSNVYDQIIYNIHRATNTSRSGSNNSTTSGISWRSTVSGEYYDTPGGASGGSLLRSNYITNYIGGSGSYDEIATDFEIDLNNNILEISNIPVTSSGGAALNTTIKKNGTRSGYFSGAVSNTGFSIQKPALGINFTAEAWIYPTAYVQYGYIFDLRGLLSFFVASLGQLVVSVNSGTDHSTFSTANGVVPLNTWTHVALVKNSSGAFIYVNGVLAASNSTWATYSDTNTTLWIGYAGFFPSYDGGVARAFRGYIDRVRLYPYTRYSSTFTTEENVYKTLPISATSSIDSKLIFPQDIFLASGGGGGASAAVTETFDSGTLVLAHHNITTPLKDNSVWNNTALTGATTNIVSTSSIGVPSLPNIYFSDGVLSSSAIIGSAGTASSYYVTPGYDIGTGSFSIESFVYLKNKGDFTGANTITSYVLCAGFSGSLVGAILGLTSSVSNPTTAARIRLWSNNTLTTASTGEIMFNQWNHLVMQKSGTQLQAYVNGVAYLSSVSTPTVNGQFGYSQGSSTTATALQTAFNGFAKELRVLNRAQTLAEIQSTYSGALVNFDTGSFAEPAPLEQSYPGGLGGNGAWGSGGGGGGASTNNTGSSVGTQQGGNGGAGYVAVISYKY